MPNYTQFIAELQEELRRLCNSREHTDRQIKNVVAAIEATQALAQNDDMPIVHPVEDDTDTGFTDRVRAVLSANSARALTAVEVRDVLVNADPSADTKTVLIHAHNTLKRLRSQGELEEVKLSEGKTGYRIKVDLSPADNDRSHLLRAGNALIHGGGRK